MSNDLMQPEHHAGMYPLTFSGRGAAKHEDGVLVDALDYHPGPYSRAAVEFDYPNEFRGGGKDPNVDDTTVTVRRR